MSHVKCFTIKKREGHKETFEGKRYIYYLDCGDGYIRVYICVDSPTYMH